ncbi:MAG TPA: hypothetical protein VHD62_07155 [Opitutaceae bacterium]|nr:hypothetical protein [Opitutaceae bacterium]
MNRPVHAARRRPRAWLVAALAPVAFLLGGCVYLRLLELKHQLADFDRNFTIQTTNGLRLTCLHPVLLSSDVRWLGLGPSTVQKLGAAERWHLRWIKQLPPGVEEKGNFEIAFDLIFVDGKLTTFLLSESYFALMPKDFLIASIKSLGGAKVNEKDRSVESRLAAPDRAAFTPPSRSDITGMLGVPTEEHREGDRLMLRYRCVSDAPGLGDREFDIRLVFDAGTDRLLQTTGRIPIGTLNLDFTPATNSP